MIDKREVSSDEGINLCKSFETPFVETSAKLGQKLYYFILLSHFLRIEKYPKKIEKKRYTRG